MAEPVVPGFNPRIADRLLDLIPPDVRELPDCLARVGAMAAALTALADAIGAFDGCPDSAARLKYASAAYFEALMLTVEYAVALRTAAAEKIDATTH
jgi:hypothetical protein